MDGIVGFLLAAVSLAGSPGPATLSLAAAGAAFGARPVLPYLAGMAAGMLLIMAVAAAGAIGALFAIPGVRAAAVTLAAGYMAYLAWRIATAPPLTETGPPARRPAFAGGLVLSLLNPKGYAAVAALFSGFVLAEGAPVLDAALKVAGMSAVALASFFAWLALGTALTRCLRRPGLSRAINLGFALLLLLAVAAALF